MPTRSPDRIIQASFGSYARGGGGGGISLFSSISISFLNLDKSTTKKKKFYKKNFQSPSPPLKKMRLFINTTTSIPFGILSSSFYFRPQHVTVSLSRPEEEEEKNWKWSMNDQVFVPTLILTAQRRRDEKKRTGPLPCLVILCTFFNSHHPSPLWLSIHLFYLST